MYQSPQIKSSLSNGSHADQKKTDLTTWNYLKLDGDRHSQVRWISFRGHDFHQDVGVAIAIDPFQVVYLKRTDRVRMVGS